MEEQIKFSFKTDAEVEKYFTDWLQEINGQIAGKNPKHTMENYPEIEAAFKKMKIAWIDSLKEHTMFEKMHLRDVAIQELEKTIIRNLK